MSLLYAQDFKAAYALTADDVIRQSLYTPDAFAKHVQSLALPAKEFWQWQTLQSEGELLVLPATAAGILYRLELLEKPDSCEYLVLNLRASTQADLAK